MGRVHEVDRVQVDETYLLLQVDGQAYRIRWADCSPRLAHATPAQRRQLEVSPSGYGLHWPEIDEDLAITPLLRRAEDLGPGEQALDEQPLPAGACA
jgi:hypothetical protein